MSGSISSASHTIATSLTDIEVLSSLTAIKTVGFLFFIIIISCCCLSLMAPTPDVYRHRCTSEDFVNTPPGETWTHIPTDKYQRIPLTAPDSPDNTPLNLLLGQAFRRISKKQTTIGISANLYVLDGHVFDEVPNSPPVDHAYRAVLETNNGDILELGSLVKGGDGMYTITYATERDIEHFTQLRVQYEQKGISPIVMIRGQFANIKKD